MINSSQINYIKNITRNQGNNLAYMEQEVGDIFTLHFPSNKKWFPKNYDTPSKNDLIVLFQKLKQGRTYNYYFTHLVIPIVPKSFEVKDNLTHPYGRTVAVVAKNNKLVPLGSEYNFKNCARGQIFAITKIEYSGTFLPTPQIQQLIWNNFNIGNVEILDDIDFLSSPFSDYDIEVTEGEEKMRLKLHRFKERNYSIIKLAKDKAKEESKLYCWVCTFDFESEYPGHGEGFIECHHIEPISTGRIRKTRIEDLAMVCPNCHRMLHRKKDDGTYPSIEELKEIKSGKG